MLQINVPNHCLAERRWICDELFRNYLGIPFKLCPSNGERVSITQDRRRLVLDDSFFSQAQVRWLSSETCPKLPLARWDVTAAGLAANLVEDSVPVLFGTPGFRMDRKGNGELGLDVLGGAFFVLSRYEEVVVRERDNHGRFPATASVAHKAGFVERPLVDEYAEILWAAMKRIWPGLHRRPRVARNFITCDVDHPYVCGGETLKGAIRRVGGDLVKRRSLALALRSVRNAWRARKGDYSSDPYLAAIAWMMDVNEKAGNRVTFNFIPDQTDRVMDGCYRLDEPVVRGILREIERRGHEIGVHPSYNTYLDADRIRHEAGVLRKVMESEHVYQEQVGGRQHYLRWETPITARNWEAAGLSYDSTLSYADRPGFRCGTSREFTLYDPVERRPLNLKERPLVVMECASVPENYPGVWHDTVSLDAWLTIKRRCLRFGGDFTLLWHNSLLSTPIEREMYTALVNA